MKRALLLLNLLVTTSSFGQNSRLDEMVNAEKAFIEMARTVNRRDAFLSFLGDSAVTQGPNGPIKGKARIAAQPVSEDWLSWEIRYSDIAASGDFGFNTGPWYYRPKKSDPKPSGYGQFNSIWKRQPDGTWKNVLDIGISHGVAEGPVIWGTTALPSKALTSPGESVREIEERFLQAITADRTNAYERALSAEAHLMVSGSTPFKGKSQLSACLSATPPMTDAVLLGGETASSGDMGYVYGTATITPAGNNPSRKATYVRVWKREAEGWKIVLDVLSY